MNTDNHLLRGKYIFASTRKQAIADGQQVDVTMLSAEAGINIPVFVTREVFDKFVVVPEGVKDRDKTCRFWDVLTTLQFTIRTSSEGIEHFAVELLYVCNDNGQERIVKLIAACGALDVDDLQPAITILLADES